jgi:hypothetical protein
MWATRQRHPSSKPQAGASCPQRSRAANPVTRCATPSSARGRQAPDGAGWRCTTRRGNAHGTATRDAREVLYRWHPWAGRSVRVREVIQRAGGALARCSGPLEDHRSNRDLPLWMFDPAICPTIRLAADPEVALDALVALAALLTEASLLSTAAGCRDDMGSHDRHQGKNHATRPTTSTRPERPGAASAVRADADQGPDGDGALGHAARGDAADGDGVDDPSSRRS